MDLAGETLPYHHRLLGRWKAAGVKFTFIVYDLLPALYPQWFTRRSRRSYQAWIRTVAIFADTTACISRSVRDEFERWIAATYGDAVGSSIDSRWFHLSGEMSGSELPQADALAARLERETSVLMVGTVEPRKGHAQALAAFEALWRDGVAVNLVIAGRAGWNVRDLVHRMRAHPEIGKRLVWLEDVSDERLRRLYRSVTGVLAASRGEGFGLPVVEAARHGRPILARDLPVFREIAGENATYFSGDAPGPLAESVKAWLDRIQARSAPNTGLIPQFTWSESARQLLACLPLG
jgi:glycosyltransferase involved in cell wall biosynthesis